MNIIKGKGQRLIPEELLKYLEALKKKYPDAVDLIEANPTLEGGEESLSSVLINGTKYAVGGGGSKLYRHEINISNDYYFTLFSSDNSPLTFTTLGMNHAGNYALTYPYSLSLSSELRLANSLKVISAVTIELYGYKIQKDTLDVTVQRLSTINTSGNTITDTVTEV